MMGGPGNAKEDAEFGDLELSAVAEAMNQMIGSASTSMATMINRKVDILPPMVKLWENRTTSAMTASIPTASSIEFRSIWTLKD